MAWDSIRKEYEPLITEVQASIDTQLRLYGQTANPIHRKFAEDQIVHLSQLKDYITNRERIEAKYESAISS